MQKVPLELRSLHPSWASCSGAIVGVYDPPHRMAPAASVDPITAPGAPTPSQAAPQQAPKQPAVQTAAPADPSAKAQDPPKNPAANNDPSASPDPKPANNDPSTDPKANDPANANDPTNQAPTNNDPANKAPANSDPSNNSPANKAPTSDNNPSNNPSANDPASNDPATNKPSQNQQPSSGPAKSDPSSNDPQAANAGNSDPSVNGGSGNKPANQDPGAPAKQPVDPSDSSARPGNNAQPQANNGPNSGSNTKPGSTNGEDSGSTGSDPNGQQQPNNNVNKPGASNGRPADPPNQNQGNSGSSDPSKPEPEHIAPAAVLKIGSSTFTAVPVKAKQAQQASQGSEGTAPSPAESNGNDDNGSPAPSRPGTDSPAPGPASPQAMVIDGTTLQAGATATINGHKVGLASSSEGVWVADDKGATSTAAFTSMSIAPTDLASQGAGASGGSGAQGASPGGATAANAAAISTLALGSNAKGVPVSAQIATATTAGSAASQLNIIIQGSTLTPGGVMTLSTTGGAAPETVSYNSANGQLIEISDGTTTSLPVASVTGATGSTSAGLVSAIAAKPSVTGDLVAISAIDIGSNSGTAANQEAMIIQGSLTLSPGSSMTVTASDGAVETISYDAQNSDIIVAEGSATSTVPVSMIVGGYTGSASSSATKTGADAMYTGGAARIRDDLWLRFACSLSTLVVLHCIII